MNIKVKVIRDYSGEEGEGPNKDVIAGRVLEVSEVRAAELIANKLAKKTTGKVDEAHPPLVSSEQSVSAVGNFPSGGVTSVAPVNQVEREDGTRSITTDTTPVVQETTLTTTERTEAAPLSGEKAAEQPANKRSRQPANKAAPAPENKTA